MGTFSSLVIIDTDILKERFENPVWHYSGYLHRMLLNGSPVAEMLCATLSPEEYELLEPVFLESDQEIDTHPISATALSKVFSKVYHFLKDETERLPCMHWLKEHESRWSNSIYWQDEQGVKWHVIGNHNDLFHRMDVLVGKKNGSSEPFWVGVRPILEINGKIIEAWTQTWFEYCQSDLEQVITVCEHAISLQKPVCWNSG